MILHEVGEAERRGPGCLSAWMHSAMGSKKSQGREMGASATGTCAYWMSSCEAFTISTEMLMTRLPGSTSPLAATPLLIYRLLATWERPRAEGCRRLDRAESGRYLGRCYHQAGGSASEAERLHVSARLSPRKTGYPSHDHTTTAVLVRLDLFSASKPRPLAQATQRSRTILPRPGNKDLGKQLIKKVKKLKVLVHGDT